MTPSVAWHGWGSVRSANGSRVPVLRTLEGTFALPRLWPRVAPGSPRVASILDVLQADDESRRAVVAACLEGTDATAEAALPALEDDGFVILPPLAPLRRQVVCVGLNYHAHVREGAPVVGRSADRPAEPIYFTKSAASIVGPNTAIAAHAELTTQLDYEVELAAIIGRSGVSIPRAAALDHVFGYAILNDVSARDLQASRKQWYKGKSLDGTSPFGPWIVPTEVVGDPQSLRLNLAVNGETRQEASAREMIYSVAEIIADLSRGHFLEVGDVIATGTPSGCGFAMQPPRFLQPADVLEAEITGLGSQRNVIT